MKKYIVKSVSISLLSLSLVLSGFAYVEPNKASAVTDEVVVNLTVTSGISITSPSDVTMSALSVSVNASTGSAVWNVKTNDGDGYTLAVKASASPAMVSGADSFLDYTEASAGVPDLWSVDSGNVEFGFSGIGTDVQNDNSDEYGASGQTVCDNGVASSTVNASLKYEGFTISDETLATRSSSTTTSGVDTRICFAAEQNGVYATAGAYSATITATATTL